MTVIISWLQREGLKGTPDKPATVSTETQSYSCHHAHTRLLETLLGIPACPATITASWFSPKAHLSHLSALHSVPKTSRSLYVDNWVFGQLHKPLGSLSVISAQYCYLRKKYIMPSWYLSISCLVSSCPSTRSSILGRFLFSGCLRYLGHLKRYYTLKCSKWIESLSLIYYYRFLGLDLACGQLL